VGASLSLVFLLYPTIESHLRLVCAAFVSWSFYFFFFGKPFQSALPAPFPYLCQHQQPTPEPRMLLSVTTDGPFSVVRTRPIPERSPTSWCFPLNLPSVGVFRRIHCGPLTCRFTPDRAHLVIHRFSAQASFVLPPPWSSR